MASKGFSIFNIGGAVYRVNLTGSNVRVSVLRGWVSGVVFVDHLSNPPDALK
jgi:hypothetical protein